jgi:hypothetical protein
MPELKLFLRGGIKPGDEFAADAVAGVGVCLEKTNRNVLGP